MSAQDREQWEDEMHEAMGYPHGKLPRRKAARARKKPTGSKKKTSSLGKHKKGVSFGAAKAREMLQNPPHGRPLSKRQKGLFGLVAGGGKPTRLKK